MAVAPHARPRLTKDQARPPSYLGTARLVVVRPPRVALWDGIRVNVQLEEKGDGGVSNSSGCLGSGSAPTAPLYFFPSRNGIGEKGCGGGVNSRRQISSIWIAVPQAH